MNRIVFPVIDPVATGENIQRLRREKGLSVRDLQNFFGFEAPQAIYKWQCGKSLPSVDNLYALSALLGVPMDDIIVSTTIQLNRYNNEQQAAACCSAFYCPAVLDAAVFRSALTILPFAHGKLRLPVRFWLGRPKAGKCGKVNLWR